MTKPASSGFKMHFKRKIWQMISAGCKNID
jgi:hypothetical protein